MASGKVKDTLAIPIGISNPVCAKCMHHANCVSPFLDPTYWDGSDWVLGWPDPDKHPGKKWIIVVGEVPSVEADQSGDIRQDGNFDILQSHCEEYPDQRSRVLYVPGMLCRPNNPRKKESIPCRQIHKMTRTQAARCGRKHLLPRVFKNYLIDRVVGVGWIGSLITVNNMGIEHVARKIYRDPSYKWLCMPIRGMDYLAFDPTNKARQEALFADWGWAMTFETMAKVSCPITWIVTASALLEWIKPLREREGSPKILFLDVESTGVDVFKKGFKIGLWSLYFKGSKTVALVPTDLPSSPSLYAILEKSEKGLWSLELQKILQELEKITTDATLLKVGHNLGYDTNAIRAQYGWKMAGVHNDTMYLHYLLDPDSNGMKGLDELVREYKPEIPDYWSEMDEYRAKHGIDNFLDVPPAILGPYAAFDTYLLSPIYDRLLRLLAAASGGVFVTSEGEHPSVPLLTYALFGRSQHLKLCTHLDFVGQAVDVAAAPKVKTVLASQVDRYKAELATNPQLIEFEQTVLPTIISKQSAQAKAVKMGEPLHINWKSLRQVKALLVDTLRLPILKRTETGAACLDEGVLQEYAAEFNSPLCETLVKIRECEKFITSFLDPLIVDKKLVVRDDGLIHASFRGAAISTGRLSACVDRNTLILTKERGLVPIWDLRPGEHVWTHRGRWMPVSAVFIKGYCEMFEVTLDCGSKVICTAAHRLLSESGEWRSLMELTLGSKVIGINNVVIPHESTCNGRCGVRKTPTEWHQTTGNEACGSRTEQSYHVPRGLSIQVSGDAFNIRGSFQIRCADVCHPEFNQILRHGVGSQRAAANGGEKAAYRQTGPWDEVAPHSEITRGTRKRRRKPSNRGTSNDWRADASANVVSGQGWEIMGAEGRTVCETLSHRPCELFGLPVMGSLTTCVDELNSSVWSQVQRGACQSRQIHATPRYGWTWNGTEKGTSSDLGQEPTHSTLGAGEDHLGDCRGVGNIPMAGQAKSPVPRVGRPDRVGRKGLDGRDGGNDSASHPLGAIFTRSDVMGSWITRVCKCIAQGTCWTFQPTTKVEETSAATQAPATALTWTLLFGEHCGEPPSTRAAIGRRDRVYAECPREWLHSGLSVGKGEVDCRGGWVQSWGQSGKRCATERHPYEDSQAPSPERLEGAEAPGEGSIIDFGCTTITSIRSVGLKDVWDMTVPVDHSYASTHPSGTCTFYPLGVQSRPNVTAIPKTGTVKHLYRPHWPSGWIITRDYSGIEVRIMAMLSRCPKLLGILREGGDVHFNTQLHFFGAGADAKNKVQRSICKQTLFGNIYGQGDQGLFDLLRDARVMSPATGKPITLEECHDFNQLLYEAYPGVGEWIKQAHVSGIVRQCAGSGFGFIRRLHALSSWEYSKRVKRVVDYEDIKAHPDYRRVTSAVSKDLRRAQNAPVQSTAGDLTTFSALRIQETIERRGMGERAFVCSVIHDDIWVSSRDTQDVPEILGIMENVMDNPHKWMPKVLPGFDASWLELVPIFGECELGVSPKDTVPGKMNGKTLEIQLSRRDFDNMKFPERLIIREDDADKPVVTVDFLDVASKLRPLLEERRNFALSSL